MPCLWSGAENVATAKKQWIIKDLDCFAQSGVENGNEYNQMISAPTASERVKLYFQKVTQKMKVLVLNRRRQNESKNSTISKT